MHFSYDYFLYREVASNEPLSKVDVYIVSYQIINYSYISGVLRDRFKFFQMHYALVFYLFR